MDVLRFISKKYKEETNMKKMVFLYPLEKFFVHSYFYDHLPLQLNDTIDCRYRKKGYEICYVLFPDEQLSTYIKEQPNDKIIYTDITGEIHFTKQSDGTHIYPDEQNIIDQIGSCEELVICGFHSHDCVKRIAASAIKNSINTIVDVELTELFSEYSEKIYFNKEFYNPANIKLYYDYLIDTKYPSMRDKHIFEEKYYQADKYLPTTTTEIIMENEYTKSTIK